MLKKIIYLFFIFIVQNSNAQDPIFTQFYASPLLMNPAFSGSDGNKRLGFGHRNQWEGSNHDLKTFYASGDMFIESVNSGVGITVINQYESLTNYNFIQIKASYSYQLKLTENWTLFPGISFGYGFKQFDFNSLVLGDQININNGSVSSGSVDPVLLNDKIGFFDISVGGVLYNKNAWLGVSFKHLTNPDISFTEGETLSLGTFLSVHGGYQLILNSNYISENLSLFLTFNYMKQDVYNRLDFGTEIELANFSLGVLSSVITDKLYDESQAFLTFSPIVGLEFKKFKLGISYDLPLSNYYYIKGTGEITFQYFIKNTHTRKRRWQVKH